MIQSYKQTNNYTYDEENINFIQRHIFDESYLEIITMLKDVIKEKKYDRVLYDNLLKQASNYKEVDIITSIIDEEQKHTNTLQRIYKEITGKNIIFEDRYEKVDTNYLDGLKKAFDTKMTKLSKYRSLRACLPNNLYRDIIFDILIEELEHADKYHYILNNYKKELNKNI